MMDVSDYAMLGDKYVAPDPAPIINKLNLRARPRAESRTFHVALLSPYRDLGGAEDIGDEWWSCKGK